MYPLDIRGMEELSHPNITDLICQNTLYLQTLNLDDEKTPRKIWQNWRIINGRYSGRAAKEGFTSPRTGRQEIEKTNTENHSFGYSG